MTNDDAAALSLAIRELWWKRRAEKRAKDERSVNDLSHAAAR